MRRDDEVGFIGQRARPGRRVASVGLVVAAMALIGPVPADARGAATHLDPAALPRGADPAVVHLVDDTIEDGALEVPAATGGQHNALWVVAGGYVVRDQDVGARHRNRVVFVDRAGGQRVVARSRAPINVAVSATGRRIAVQRDADRSGLVSVVTVSVPRTGRVVASRRLRLVTLAGVTDHRVLLGRRARWHHPATVWWNLRQDSLRRIYGEAALSADVRHDRVVFDRTPDGDFCNRVAVLSRPAQTLWRSCRMYPHQWSPDGTHAIATHTYFDAAGTDRWWVVDGSTGTRTARVTGRLDWAAVWEDDGHFLTLAQSDAGRAAIVRCDLAGTCERASQLWDVPLPDPSVYYAAPPVVLAAR